MTANLKLISKAETEVLEESATPALGERFNEGVKRAFDNGALHSYNRGKTRDRAVFREGSNTTIVVHDKKFGVISALQADTSKCSSAQLVKGLVRAGWHLQDACAAANVSPSSVDRKTEMLKRSSK